jgi:hypothetical protein
MLRPLQENAKSLDAVMSSICPRGVYQRAGHPADVLDHAIAQHDDDRAILG